VFISSFFSKKAYWKLEKFDYICGIFSVLALLLWAITKEPFIAILFAILSDGFAAVPTLIKLWKHPETEHPSPYLTGLFSSLMSFTVIKSWAFVEVAFPIYLITVYSLLLLSFYRKKIFLKLRIKIR
jgi:hypothetical protein